MIYFVDTMAGRILTVGTNTEEVCGDLLRLRRSNDLDSLRIGRDADLLYVVDPEIVRGDKPLCDGLDFLRRKYYARDVNEYGITLEERSLRTFCSLKDLKDWMQEGTAAFDADFVRFLDGIKGNAFIRAYVDSVKEISSVDEPAIPRADVIFANYEKIRERKLRRLIA